MIPFVKLKTMQNETVFSLGYIHGVNEHKIKSMGIISTKLKSA